MSPALSPARSAGLPFATSATVNRPDDERCIHAPAHAVAWPAHSILASAVVALVECIPQWSPPANAGATTARARTAAAERVSAFFMFPPESSWTDGHDGSAFTAVRETV